MNLVRRLKNTASNFAADKRGQYSIIFALCSGVLMISVGLSVDYARIISAKSQLTSALDAAVTSTARDITRGKVNKKEATRRVQAFLEANLDGKRLTKDNVHLTDVSINPVTSELSASARVDVDMMFPVMNTPKVQAVNVGIAALYSERKVEVSMVLDVTGSMRDPVGGSTKIKELKIASKSAVKAFLENGSNNTRVAITPYSYGVNVGNGLLKSTVVGENGLPAPDSCAAERRGPLMFSDASPVAGKVTRPNTFSYFDVKDKVYYDIKHWNGQQGWKCPTNTIRPLTRDAAALNSAIDNLKADGATAGQIGIQWGWYMLSPNWKSVLPAASEPVDYNTADTEKYLILMTDGMFNTEASGLSAAALPVYPGISLASGRLAMSYCAAIKDKKVKLYTIGFDLKHAGDAAQQAETVKMLSECASKPTGSEQTFYSAENGDDLKKAFDDIARRIQSLRLTN
jgi:Flp pilus assembly protein TadG